MSAEDRSNCRASTRIDGISYAFSFLCFRIRVLRPYTEKSSPGKRKHFSARALADVQYALLAFAFSVVCNFRLSLTSFGSTGSKNRLALRAVLSTNSSCPPWKSISSAIASDMYASKKLNCAINRYVARSSSYVCSVLRRTAGVLRSLLKKKSGLRDQV
jgi:hypothetical protein